MDSLAKNVAKAAIVAVMIFSRAVAQASADQDPLSVAGLLKFENERAQAEANYDAAAIERDVADDLMLVHGNGQFITKPQYVDSMKHDSHFVVSIELSDQKGAVYGNIGVTDGIMENDLKNNMKHVSRYLGVYRYENGHWLLFRWQTTDISRGKR